MEKDSSRTQRYLRRESAKSQQPNVELSTMATNIVMTQEMLQQLLAGVMINVPRNVEPVPALIPEGNFVDCKSRFSGKRTDSVDAFIDGISVYKQCANVSDANALLGLSMLLDSDAATWWQGAKTTVTTWKDAMEALQHAFGRNQPPYQIYRELFSKEQGKEPTDIFVNKARALLSKLPSADEPIPLKSQIDMIYGLLHSRIRRNVPRDSINSFETLITKARAVEANFSENFDSNLSNSSPKVKDEEKFKPSRPKCTFCHNFGHTIEACRKYASTKPTEVVNTSTSSSTVKPSFSCYGCGLAGYLRSNCPQCRRTQRPSPSETNSVDVLNLEICSSSYSNEKPLLEIEIAGLRGLATVDTGAKYSIAGEKLYQHLKQVSCPSTKISLTVSFADGEPRNVHAVRFECQVQVQSKLLTMFFIAMPEYTNSKTLLGCDFIQMSNIILDIPRMRWAFAEEPGNFYKFCTPPSQSNHDCEINILNQHLHLRDDEASGDIIEDEQRLQLENLILLNNDVFEVFSEPTPYAEHSINLTSTEPTSSPPYRMSPMKKEYLKEELDKMIQEGVIEECESPYSAPVVLVPKKNGKLRVCVDYRALNRITISDCYPIPRMDDLLHATGPTPFMSTIDLRSGYWQVSVKPSDRDKTAFVSPFGTFRFKRMPFGLKTAPATFQRLIDKFRTGLPDITILAYLDDIIILSPSFQKHIEDLNKVFARLRQFKLTANREKCSFLCANVKYLGHRLTREGIAADPDKVTAIADLPPPRNVKHLLSFIQTASWFRRFIPEFAGTAKPLTELTKKNAVWRWGQTQQNSFDTLKRLLTSAPILRQADPTQPYVLRTDASSYAIGACLLQGEGPNERPVEYASRLLTQAERNYSTTEREALAVVFAVQKFRGYIEGCKIRILTDHQPLRWLMTLKSPSGRLARWALLLQGFDLDIEYTPGRCNVVADALSRPPCTEEAEFCGICSVTIDLPKMPLEDLRKKQLNDPDVVKIINCFENPENQVDLKRWTERGFIMMNGVLYRYSSDIDSEDAQLVVPKEYISEILFECHDSPVAGHYGLDKTLHRVSSKYYWATMRRDVTNHIKKCIQCQRFKPDNRKPAGFLQTPVLAQRFEVLSVDLFGPLPEAETGEKWVYIIEDPTTKWVELFALKVATAEACARVLIDEIILRYGTPRRVISDNGTQFVAEVMQYVAYTLGFVQNLVPLYHPEANPVERRNRDLKTQLAILTQENHRKWNEHLPSIRFAINSARNDATGFSAAQLCFGRELRTPGEVYRDFRGVIENENFNHQIGSYLRVIANNLSRARENCERRQDASKALQDRHRREGENYQPGEKVLIDVHALSKASLGFSAKFAPRRDGPYVILKKISPTTYQIAEVGKTDTPLGTYHVSAIRRFVGNDDPDPQPVVPIRKRGRPRKNTI